jgi:PAS domain S-box-containing protein
MTTRRILIVHDDLAAAGELEARLTGFGHEVGSIAWPGGEAVARSAAAAELVVLVLPRDIAAGSAADTIRRHQLMPIVVVGTAADEARLHDAGATAATVFLAAPFGDRELRLTLELALCRQDAAVSTRELDDYFAISLDMLCILGFDFHFRRLNPAWERTLGFTREELMSRPFIEFVHPDDRERTLTQNAEVRAGGQARGFENRYLCKDGSYRWFLWNAAPHAPGRVIYSVARDVTERRQADVARAELVRELEASLAEVRTLRTILPICSYCKKIRDDGDYWHTVESYIECHTATQFSHGICPGCMTTVVEPQLAKFERD